MSSSQDDGASNIEHRVELLEHPDRLIVRVHEELPRDPKRPHFVQTRPVDRVYVPYDAGAVYAEQFLADLEHLKCEDDCEGFRDPCAACVVHEALRRLREGQ